MRDASAGVSWVLRAKHITRIHEESPLVIRCPLGDEHESYGTRSLLSREDLRALRESSLVSLDVPS